MKHIRGAPMHPQTQGKIERWHQTLKNRILLENYFLVGELEAAIAAFIANAKLLRIHADMYNKRTLSELSCKVALPYTYKTCTAYS